MRTFRTLALAAFLSAPALTWAADSADPRAQGAGGGSPCPCSCQMASAPAAAKAPAPAPAPEKGHESIDWAEYFQSRM